MIASTSKQ